MQLKMKKKYQGSMQGHQKPATGQPRIQSPGEKGHAWSPVMMTVKTFTGY